MLIRHPYRPSLINSMNARPAFFCNEFCHSWEQSSMTNSTTDWLVLNVVNPLPSASNSCPWEPSNVFERNGEKSTMISRNSGQTEPRAASSCCVSEASRVISDVLNGAGNGRKTNHIKSRGNNQGRAVAWRLRSQKYLNPRPMSSSPGYCVSVTVS